MPSRSKKHKSTLITVEQLVDIALGNPEIGSVNFNVLHALLHVIIRQINIQGCLVEFKGSDSERMEGLIMTAKPGPILRVTEYMINKTDGKPCKIGKDSTQLQTMTDRPHPSKNENVSYDEEDISSTKIDDMINNEKSRKSVDSEAPPEKRKKRSSKDEVDEIEENLTEDEKENDRYQKKVETLKKKEDFIKKKDEENQVQGSESEKELKKLSKKKKNEGKKATVTSSQQPEDKKSEVEKTDDGKNKEEKGKKTCVCPCKGTENTRILELEEEKSDKPSPICPEMKLKQTSLPYYGPECDTCQTIVRVEAIGERCDTWRTRPALARESLVKLEEKVTLLQEAFETLEKMPTNEELKKRSCSDPCPSTPIKDMWQLYNLNKRMECCEGAIEKLATMIEDIMKETCNLREAMMVVADAVDSMETNEETICKGVSICCDAKSGEPHREQQPPPLLASSIEMRQEVIAFPVVEPNPCEAFATLGRSPATKTNENQMEEIQQDQDDETTEITEMEHPQTRKTTLQPNGKLNYNLGPDFQKLTSAEKFCVLKENIECLTCQLKSFTELIPLDQLAGKLCTIVTMQKQLDNLQKEWETFLQCFSNEGIPGICNYIKRLRLDIEAINETIARTLEDRRQLEMTIQSITQEIAILKAIKADKDTMEDLLAEKADAAVVNRKVSHDQFDAACDDLTKGLDEALEKLIAQELMWNEAMEELQRDLENKLDKMEIMPLKEFINKKLKSLQEKLQQLAQLRKDAEAAGTKSRILRNLNCIACDNDVIMRMDNKNVVQHLTMTQNRTMRPYITYELDQVRKALKKGPTCRPTSHIEEMTTEIQRKSIGLPLSREGVETKMNKLEHYCNRYCGGSHTITTPQQRVTRIGHFLTEFGPHALAMINQETLTDCKSQETGNLPIPNKDIKLL